jgi:glucose-1-phosphate cytidylyltransferase
MKHYSHHGFKEFYIALGYRGDVIKRFFLDYFNLSGNMTVDLSSGKVEMHDRECEDWVVHLVDTGFETQTGGRIKRLEPFLKDAPFMVTYGDGLCDIDLGELFKFHRTHGRIATVTAVRPPSRFGGLIFEGEMITEFTEKPQIGEGWINGGFLVFEPALFDYLHNDQTVLESGALEQLAADRQLMALQHDQFWQCMDTLRDKNLLESLWQEHHAPWKVWD